MNFTFPRTKFVELNGITSQILKIKDEVAEAFESALTPDIEHTAEEVFDIYQACETALYILHEKYNINLHEIRSRMERKNMLRGYYHASTTRQTDQGQ